MTFIETRTHVIFKPVDEIVPERYFRKQGVYHKLSEQIQKYMEFKFQNRENFNKA